MPFVWAKFTRTMNFRNLAGKASRVKCTGGRKKVIELFNKRNRNTRDDLKSKTGYFRYSYRDCLHDAVPVPTGLNGSTLYQLLMVGCMVTFVLSVNGVMESGASFFVHSR